jgi:hypothetical protein
MKIFLISSILAMTAACIYGTVDIMLDVKNGTLIEYEEEQPVFVQAFGAQTKNILGEPRVQVVQHREKKSPPPPTLVNSFAELSFEDFSRGEPPMIYEAMLPDQASRPDSVLNPDVAAAIADTVVALRPGGESHLDSNTTVKKEERKPDLKLFSRSKPRAYRKENADAPADSLGAR